MKKGNWKCQIKLFPIFTELPVRWAWPQPLSQRPQKAISQERTERAFGPGEFQLLLNFEKQVRVGGMRTYRCSTLNAMKWSPANWFPSRNPLSDAYLKRWCLSSIRPQLYLLKTKRRAPAYSQNVLPRLLGKINNSSGMLQRQPRMSLLSCCSKDISLIWRHLKGSLKYMFMYQFETKWVWCEYRVSGLQASGGWESSLCNLLFRVRCSFWIAFNENHKFPKPTVTQKTLQSCTVIFFFPLSRGYTQQNRGHFCC